MTRLHRLAIAIGLAAASPALAQDWRTIDVGRQTRDSGGAPLHVRVNYGAGKAAVRAADGATLYQMQLRYDARRGAPLHSWDAAGRALRLGIDRQDVGFVGGGGGRDAEGGEMQLALSRTVPLDLSLDLGAVEADLDLSGLRLESLNLSTGASETRLRFESPNPARMRALELQVGAASVTASGLANANVDLVRVKGGVGEVELDFGGQFTRDVELAVEMALGRVTVRVPREVGIRVEHTRFLSSFDHEGMTRRGDAWVSANWDSATHHVRIRSQAAFGSFRLEQR